MDAIHQVIRSNYALLSDAIQAELIFLSTLSELTEDATFRESLAEVIYSLGELLDTIDLQRRYLRSR
ncbi:hypothetical protein [Leptolyngbya sp. 7M]|uniref:hypothetical protein n=1 Tax=Leptolyngbya sp. 7M TaxID=2812896 RepID=UPI001B8D4865|nr:hypothetical protein [Leptolyngbya sp. 7M]QYO62644.1 hypothetical protein JVX88_21675 [Leptolyngbya sp. 7M]